jgi:phospholipase/carboxylesterase
MPTPLSGPSRPPVAGGKPTSLVILLHGRGSNGEDLLDLQRFWGRLLPNTEFIAPNAPHSSDMAPGGYEWFKTADRSPASLLVAVRASASNVDAFISDELQKRGLNEADAALVGFSQGTMMSLHVGPRRERPFAGIVGYAGRVLAPDLLGEELRSRPPVLLVHGTADSRIGIEAMTEAEATFRIAAVPVKTLTCVGTDHVIDEDGVVQGGLFLHQILGAPPTDFATAERQ